jgi:hypothetical protein
MAVKVLCVVLTLTKLVIRRLSQDSGAGLSRALQVALRVLNAYLHRMEWLGTMSPSAIVKQPSPARI